MKEICLTLGKVTLVDDEDWTWVYYSSQRKKWEAYISFKGKKLNLGRFSTKEEAANAYLNKAVELYGEFVPKAQDSELPR